MPTEPCLVKAVNVSAWNPAITMFTRCRSVSSSDFLFPGDGHAFSKLGQNVRSAAFTIYFPGADVDYVAIETVVKKERGKERRKEREKKVIKKKRTEERMKGRNEVRGKKERKEKKT